jgi:exopolyphosphatase/guanosine-5'-triphosphate,3'-diphosphate pyrophosphatase
LRYAAIDIGSNAGRLLIASVLENDKLLVYKKDVFVRVPLRLGENAFKLKKLSEKNAVELQKTIAAFKNLIDVYAVKEYVACATAAMREAINGKDIIEKIMEQTGVSLNIIDGKKEAELIYNTHVAEELDKGKDYLYIDVGGGSTEITFFSKNALRASNSFPIGTLRLLMDEVEDSKWDAMRTWLKDKIGDNHNTVVGIGTGGNINKIAKMIGKKETKAISYRDIKAIYNYLKTFTIEERVQKLNMNEDRADVIVPAGKIFLNIMKWADIEELYVPQLGLVDGIVHYLAEKHRK